MINVYSTIKFIYTHMHIAQCFFIIDIDSVIRPYCNYYVIVLV